MSSSLVVKYQPLSQSAPSDEEDEGFHDNVLYDSRLVVRPNMDNRNVFELEKLGQPRVKSASSIQSLRRGQRLCMLAVALVLIMLCVLVAVLFPILSHKYNHGIVTTVHTGKTSPDWLLVFNSTWTQTVVHLLDADGDGLDDVLIGLATQRGVDSMVNEFGAVVECCSPSEDTYVGHIVALRGYDGVELWRAATRSVPHFLSCDDVDVSGDGKMDCIVIGRDLTCQAIDVLTGTSLWSVDPDSPMWSSHLTPGWDVDSLVTVSDLDLDGVPDMVISVSGQSSSQNQRLGRLILLSGKTGLVIGNGYVEFNKEGEAVMPLVKFVTPEDAVYILYGSSGEDDDVSRLMAVSLPDLYHRATGKTFGKADFSIYTWLEGRDKDLDGLTVLLSAQGKGEVLTAILVEAGKDAYRNILVSSSGGFVVLLNGQTLEEKWRRSFQGLGIYSCPLPGYYDTDPVLDFMVQLHTEQCHSNSSQTLVLSGVTGETLWAFRAENLTLSSYVSLETVTSKSSVFVISVSSANISRASLPPSSDSQATSNSHTDLSSQEFQDLCRDMEQKFVASHLTCDHDLELLTEKVFLLDHIISDQPLLLLDRPAYQYSYSVQPTSGSLQCHILSSEQQNTIDMCTVLVPAAFTGAVGDVDGDGSLDYIHITQMSGLNITDTFQAAGIIGSVIVSKHNINSAIAKGEFQHLSPVPDRPTHPQGADYHQHVQSWQFSQTGTQHSISTSDCVPV